MAHRWGRRSRRYSHDYSYGRWAPYVPVAARRLQAARTVADLKRKGRTISPVEIDGRTIARTFWGRAWCDNLESYRDFAYRLERGRTYVRNGSVIDLQVGPGSVQALVSGSEVYTVKVTISPIPAPRWHSIIQDCSGSIDSVVELLSGRLSRGVMEVLCGKDSGLFPAPREIRFDCSCPDVARMCKHVAAALYGIGARLDHRPEVLFTLRQVDQTELIQRASRAGRLAQLTEGTDQKVLQTTDLSGIFGIDIDPAAGAATAGTRRPTPSPGVVRASRPAAATHRTRRPPRDVVTAKELIARGVPRTTFQNWLTSGILLPTGQRGVYRTTPATQERIERALARA